MNWFWFFLGMGITTSVQALYNVAIGQPRYKDLIFPVAAVIGMAAFV